MSTDPHRATPTGKPRARSLGLTFRGTPGPWNAITDVPGVEVGYETLIQGDKVRTGVTAIHPRGKDNPGDPVAAGFHSQNGNGEMTGVSWIEESGTFEGPVAITNTHSVGIAHAGIIGWMNRYHPEFTEVWLLPVAAETWDGYLNDINGHHVTEETVIAALEAAKHEQPDEGSVGGGTGMNCYQFKAGKGTASRQIDYAGTTYTVGVFVQANFGRRDELTVTGIYLGEEFADDNPMREARNAVPIQGAGSVIAVVATDAPLFPSQCKAFARRVTSGLARTGTSGSHFSGDLFLAVLHREPRRPHLRRPEPQRRQKRRQKRGQSHSESPSVRPAHLHPVEQPGPVFRGRRPGHRRGRAQLPGRQRGHDRQGRPPHPGAAQGPASRDRPSQQHSPLKPCQAAP